MGGEMIVEKPCKPIETYYSKNELDLKLLKKKGNEKTFKGYLIQKMKDSRNQNNFDVCALIQTIYKKYLEFETSEKFKANQWKGKSSVEYLDYPDKIIVIRYKKPEPFEQPEEVRTELLKQEINDLIVTISKLFKSKWLKTSEIAEELYQKSWKNVFSDRPNHIKLCEMLNYLEHKKIIDYKRSGKVFLK